MYTLIDFQATLEPTKASYTPQIFSYVFFRKQIIKCVKKVGFWAIGGIFRPKIYRVIIISVSIF